MAKAAIAARDVAAIGITNQRETTVVWDRATGKPIHNAIVWQDRRTADACASLRAAGHEALVAQATGLLLDPYFSATKIAWILDHVDGARARPPARQALLRHGRQLPALAPDRRPRARHRCHQCGAHAALRHPQRPTGTTSLLHAVRRAARDAAARCAIAPPSSARPTRLLGATDPDPRRRRRSAGGDGRAGLLRAGHDEIDLRHRLLRAAQHRRRAGRLAQPAAHHHRLSARWQADLCARGCDLRRRRRGAVAARRLERDRRGERDRRARGARPIPTSRSIWCRPSSGSARRTGMPRRAAPCSGSPAMRGARSSPAPRSRRSATRPATCSTPCGRTGRRQPARRCCASMAA